MLEKSLARREFQLTGARKPHIMWTRWWMKVSAHSKERWYFHRKDEHQRAVAAAIGLYIHTYIYVHTNNGCYPFSLLLLLAAPAASEKLYIWEAHTLFGISTLYTLFLSTARASRGIHPSFPKGFVHQRDALEEEILSSLLSLICAV